MEKSISVVIPNYNGRHLLAQNLPSVYQALATSGVDDFELIVADDASTDDSVAFLRQHYPEAVVLTRPRNGGFATNANAGIFGATRALVLVLNSDVALTDGYFLPLLGYFDQPDTFGVMGHVTSFDTGQRQDGAKFPTYAFGAIRSNVNYLSADTPALYTLFLSGANALINRAKLVEMGGFDELFSPYYVEDVELGLRAWRLGYRCYYDHRAVCRHPLSATIGRVPRPRVRMVARRNKMLLHCLHLNGAELAYYLMVLVGRVALRALTLNGGYVRSFGQLLARSGACAARRRAFRALQRQKGVRLRVADVVALMRTHIDRLTIEKY